MCTACGRGRARWFVRGSPAESRITHDLVSGTGAFHAWKLPRLCNPDGDISSESGFEMEDVWDDCGSVDDGGD